jgi:putative ABC transport system permease protein
MRPFAGFIAMPNARFGRFAGKLARENAMRYPARTAATAAALMIGLALVTFVAVLGQGLRTSIRQSVEKQVLADYIVSPKNPLQPLPTKVGRGVAKVSGVVEASSVRGDSAKVAGNKRSVTGIDPATIESVYHFDWKKGAGSNAVIGNLGQQGAIVSKGLADDKNLRVGSTVPIITNSKQASFTVKGIFKPPALGSLLGAVAITQKSFDSTFPRAKDQNIYVNVSGGPTDATTRTLDRSLDDFPVAKLETRDEFISSQQQSISLLLALLYVLLGLSILISLFGMVNTLALSILERTRELGMLRAVGMTRKQIRSTVRHESIVIASIGAAMGFPLGIFLALLVTRALKSEGIVFAVPGKTLVIMTVIANLAGVAAAILPARRGSRLNILEALRYE